MTKIESLPYNNLTFVADILYIDGPVLSHYKDSEKNDILFYWVDFESGFNKWLIIDVELNSIIQYLEQKICLKQLLKSNKSSFVFIQKKSADEIVNEIYCISNNSINDQYYPDYDVFYTDDVPSYYSEIVNSFDYHLVSLREDALFLKLEPIKLISGTAVDAKHAGQFLTKISESFIEFTKAKFKKSATNDSYFNKIKTFDSLFSPKIVQLNYASFGVGINFNKYIIPQFINEDFKDTVSKQYEHEVLCLDYNNKKIIDNIQTKHNNDKRIYLPIIELLSNENYKLNITDRTFKTKGSVKQVKKTNLSKYKHIFKVKEEVEKVETKLGEVEVINGNKKRIKGLFSSNIENPSLTINEINFDNEKLKLTVPITLIVKKEEDGITITSNEVGIYSFGSDEKDALNNFSEEFIFAYKRYNELEDKELTPQALRAKNFIKLYLNSLT